MFYVQIYCFDLKAILQGVSYSFEVMLDCALFFT